MAKKAIRMNLSSDDIDRAIREINAFKQEFRKKVDTYRKRIAEEIAVKASLGFGSAIVDDVIQGGSSRRADVSVSVSDKGQISVVVADGEDAVWCEFGAGVYHNGSVGSSPNPYGKELGFTIGSYGKGYGKGQVWGYYTDPDSKTGLVLTHGTPASMPMYNAAQEVLHKSVQIAREVFGS
jgi:hypothetical protein